MRVDLQLFVILLLGCGGVSSQPSDCKSYDERSKSAGKSSSTDRKVVCSNMELHQVLPPDSFPNRTVTLILNNNKIQELRNGSFFGLSALEKLDLRSNIISHVEPGAFLGLPALKRLDLSNNSIGCLNMDIFKGLTSLIRLNLSGNMFSSLAQGTFDSLVSLKALEFQTPYLLCDCNLAWLLRWIKERNIAVKNTKCSYPQSLQSQPITSIRPELLTCDAPLELPSFQLTPSQRQVVFQGDSLPFQCQASFVAEDMQVLWYQDGRMVMPDAAQGIFIEKRMVQNCSLIASALTISNIQPGFTGNWECRIWTSRGNTTRTVHIVVLESSTKYCTPERTSNNKGEFRWPRTLAGFKAYLPCNRLPASAGTYSGSSVEEQQAWRYCDREGLWAEDDYSRCQFQKDVTRFLYVINQMPLNESNVVPRARRLLVYTIDAANFSDKMDIIFVAEMIEKFGKFVEKFKDLGEVMVSMASNLMLTDERVLWMAQREAMACSRIIACLQRIAVFRLAAAQAFSLTSPNIALEAHTVRANDWNGMSCMLFQRLSPERTPNQDRQLTFKCNTTSSFSSILHKSTVVEASLQLPQSLFAQAALPGQTEDPVFKLHLLAFRNGKFFPSTGNSSQLADGGKRRSVATPVIMAKIDGMSLHVLRTPVNITLRRFARGSDPVSACWNFSLAGGQGGWQSDGCRILGHHDNFTTISCNSLGNYGLLMDLSNVEYLAPTIQPLHPVIYATSIILLLCLLTIIVSYIYHHRSVRVSRKFWHMLVNLCFHISLTCGVFVGGINQTRYASVCQAVGILLHYSTLATALWVGVTARNIYKQVTRKAKRYEELDEPPPPPRPMLRFYLIGGGIPIIVCGITAAANIRNYGSRTNAPYCWMAWEPSIGAFYGPVGFIIFVDCMYFLSILLQLRRHPERRYELKEPNEEHQHLAPANTEVGPDGPHSPCHPLTLQLHPHDAASSMMSTPHTVHLSALENEHTFSAQLMGAAGALGLYAALWVFGAMAVSQDHPYDLAFTCLFGVAALALGAFMVAHHCVNRQDMRRYWSQACCSGRRAYSAQEDVLLSQPDVAMTSTAGSANKADGESTKCGHSSADSSYTNKSAPSMRNSNHGSKLTNLHAEAAQCKSASAPVMANGTAILDNSLTEHSLDNEIKMHVAPVEVQFRPMNNVNNPTAATNGHTGRHHKNRARTHRASRLTVLREYAYDVPTSVEGSVQSASHRRHHHYDVAARISRRAAYMAYRERHQSQLQHDSSDSASLPRRSRYSEKGGVSSIVGNGTLVTIETERVATVATSSSSKDSGAMKQPGSTELESEPKSYGLNLVTQNGVTLKENGQALPLINTESAAAVKTGLWKHETTV
ncbi:adhesion G protein-coupled receptor A3 [Solea senegalensis]|uniref:Adhesion G protein-coupled receptor A3 n=2 Tax=Solea senegalensis TaxID=28829 RepID=A0AAV6QVN7_SOLSE|nr:adhesion G protein-coupled receptor A3 [Solea senegalensis]KAG7495752.1 adhesion G protein-coupled receptor A3 [Solea senegalensis]